MKRFFIGILISFSVTYGATKDDVLMLITSYHTRVFSKENLISQRIMPDERQSWNNLLMPAVRDFVQQNAPRFMSYFNDLSKSSDQLINNLKIIYADTISKAVINPANKQKGASIYTDMDPNKINIKFICNKMIDLVEVKKNFMYVNSKLSREKISNKDIAKQEVREVLLRLYLTLDTTLNKALSDFIKIATYVNPNWDRLEFWQSQLKLWRQDKAVDIKEEKCR